MWQRLTKEARTVVFYAQEQAQRFGERYISTEYLLLGLIHEGNNSACAILEQMGISRSRVRAEVEKQLPRGDASPSSEMAFTPRSLRVIECAREECRLLASSKLCTHHLLLGLLAEGEGLAARVLRKLGATLEDVRQRAEAISEEEESSPEGELAFTSKSAFGSAYLDPLLLSIRQGVTTPSLLLLLATAYPDGTAGELLKRLGVHLSTLQYDLATGIGSFSQPSASMGLDEILEAASSAAAGHAGPMDSGDLIFALRDLGALEPLGGIEIGRIRDTLRRIRGVKEDREQ